MSVTTHISTVQGVPFTTVRLCFFGDSIIHDFLVLCLAGLLF